MTTFFPTSPARFRVLSGILTVLAAGTVSACRESHEEHAAYTPGSQRGQVVAAGNTWPELPCLPRTDPRLIALDHDCGAEDYEVIAGPNPVTNDAGQTTCNYRITFTTERGVSCVNGRPLIAAGAHVLAPLVSADGWS